MLRCSGCVSRNGGADIQTHLGSRTQPLTFKPHYFFENKNNMENWNTWIPSSFILITLQVHVLQDLKLETFSLDCQLFSSVMKAQNYGKCWKFTKKPPSFTKTYMEKQNENIYRPLENTKVYILKCYIGRNDTFLQAFLVEFKAQIAHQGLKWSTPKNKNKNKKMGGQNQPGTCTVCREYPNLGNCYVYSFVTFITMDVIS